MSLNLIYFQAYANTKKKAGTNPHFPVKWRNPIPKSAVGVAGSPGGGAGRLINRLSRASAAIRNRADPCRRGGGQTALPALPVCIRPC